MTHRWRIWRPIALSLLLLAATIRPSSSEADDVALIVRSRQILSVASMIDKQSLVGRTVWVGDNRGFRGTAKVEPNPHFARDTVLNRDFGDELGLAFTDQTTFVEIGAKKLAPGAISKLVLKRAKELGAVSVDKIELVELARLDLSGDDVPEVLISAHTTRDLSDPYFGKAGDIESIFVVTIPNEEPKILDQIAKVLDAKTKFGRPHISLAALGQNPVTKSWTLLLLRHERYWQEQTTNVLTPTESILAVALTLEKGKFTVVSDLLYQRTSLGQ